MNARPDPFADLESDFDGRATTVVTTVATDLIDLSHQHAERTLANTSAQRVPVKCSGCRGTGKFYGYTGRLIGDCFKCKGAGTIMRAPGYEIAKAKREAAKVAKAARVAAELKATQEATLIAHPAEIASLVAYSAQSRYSSVFMGALWQQFARTGTLSEGQLASLARGVERQRERDAERGLTPTEFFPRIEKLVRADNLSLHLGCCNVVRFRSGAVAVVAPTFGDGTFGIIEAGGGLKRFAKLTDAVLAVLRDVETNGLEAVKRIGQATGHCCVCGRLLTNEASIDDGIGPVCSGRMEGF